MIHGNVQYEMINETIPLCLPQWLHLFGFCPSDSTVKRALQSTTTLTDLSCASNTKRNEGKRDTQMDRAQRWCVHYIKEHMGDKSPTTGKNMIRAPVTCNWLKLYKTHEEVYEQLTPASLDLNLTLTLTLNVTLFLTLFLTYS